VVKLLSKLYTKFYIWTRCTKLSFSLSHFLSRVLNSVFLFFLSGSQVAEFESVEKLNIFLKGLEWSEDRFRFLGLSISHNWIKDARLIQRSLNRSESIQMDCDEFAAYGEAALSRTPGVNAIEPGMLTVRWIDREGRIKGHNVAYFMYLPDSDQQLSLMKYAHLGNWGLFKNFDSVAAMADDIAKQGGGLLISYARVCDIKLKKHTVCKENIASYIEDIFYVGQKSK